ncbi:hypothetical protein K9L27_00910 [Candidatus Gracilibacteria bacterium]|nr:hypothetical protein [Candidatus Gracilibacteria bacterium]
MIKINKRLGISELEATRVKLTWGTRFLFQIGFVVSWTIVTALFVERFGIHNLLFLFLFDAGLCVLGTLFASFLIPRLELRTFLALGVFLTILSVGASFFWDANHVAFFICVILAKDLFFSQVNIALYRRTESFFSPSEAQRLMPIIESAITFGAVVGAGLTLVFLEFLPTQYVLSVWLVSLVLIGVIVWNTPKILHTLPHFRIPKVVSQKTKNPLAEAVHGVGKIKFLRYILLALLLQTAVFSIIEFEFTKEVQGHVFSEPSQEVSFNFSQLKASLFSDIQSTVVEVSHEVEETVEQATSHLIMHKTLAHDLGAFHLLFGLLALFVQLLTPKILQKLGIIGSMITYFSILIIGLGATFLGYMPISILRAWQHGTHSIGETPYHISFYSLFSHSRESVRLFLEGIVKPLGVALGAFTILFISGEFVFAVGLGAIIILFVLGWNMKKSFTELSKENLKSDQDIEGKLHSIEVLGQRGHKNQGVFLAEELEKQDLHSVIRSKLIHTISNINDPRSVHTYIRILRNETEKQETKIDILDSLFHLEIPEQYWAEHAFTRYHLLGTLKEIFSQESQGHLKKLVVMNIFKHLPSHQVVPFFLETMKNADEKLKSIYLRSCKMFRDPEIAFYVQQYLDYSSPRIRSHAVIALWKFYNKTKLREVLDDLLQKDNEGIIAAVYAIGEVDDESYKEVIFQYAHSNDSLVRLHALIALAKLKDERCMKGILEILFGDNEELSRAALHMLDRVSLDIRMHIEKEIQYEVSRRVATILQPQNHHFHELNELPENIFQSLKHLYWMAERYDDILVMDHLRGSFS